MPPVRTPMVQSQWPMARRRLVLPRKESYGPWARLPFIGQSRRPTPVDRVVTKPPSDRVVMDVVNPCIGRSKRPDVAVITSPGQPEAKLDSLWGGHLASRPQVGSKLKALLGRRCFDISQQSLHAVLHLSWPNEQVAMFGHDDKGPHVKLEPCCRIKDGSANDISQAIVKQQRLTPKRRECQRVRLPIRGLRPKSD